MYLVRLHIYCKMIHGPHNIKCIKSYNIYIYIYIHATQWLRKGRGLECAETEEGEDKKSERQYTSSLSLARVRRNDHQKFQHDWAEVYSTDPTANLPPPPLNPLCAALTHPFTLPNPNRRNVHNVTHPHFLAANLIRLTDPEDDGTNAPSKYFETSQFTSRQAKR